MTAEEQAAWDAYNRGEGPRPVPRHDAVICPMCSKPLTELLTSCPPKCPHCRRAMPRGWECIRV